MMRAVSSWVARRAWLRVMHLTTVGSIHIPDVVSACSNMRDKHILAMTIGKPLQRHMECWGWYSCSPDCRSFSSGSGDYPAANSGRREVLIWEPYILFFQKPPLRWSTDSNSDNLQEGLLCFKGARCISGCFDCFHDPDKGARDGSCWVEKMILWPLIPNDGHDRLPVKVFSIIHLHGYIKQLNLINMQSLKDRVGTWLGDSGCSC